MSRLQEEHPEQWAGLALQTQRLCSRVGVAGRESWVVGEPWGWSQKPGVGSDRFPADGAEHGRPSGGRGQEG